MATLIVAPPPTPNGDLHVGHLSGPYLAADIYRRFLRQRGAEAAYVVSSDDHQSYVDTTAARLGMTAPDLIAQARQQIHASFETYAIGLNGFGRPNADYIAYVSRFFDALARAGLITVEKTPVLFDRQTNSYPVEAFVSGYCPTCLESTCGGICEACGHPNAGVDLLGLDLERYEVRREPRLMFALETSRRAIEEALDTIVLCRPALRRLVRVLLSRKLEPFVASYVAPRGIDTAPFGLPGQRLNVWAEMYPGHMYWLTKYAAPPSAADTYLQFLGFDNSYFYVIVHVALAVAARRLEYDWPLPRAFVTNQFYYLDSRKFSTSQRHAVWARDLARDWNPDLTRLFLALHGPEHQEATFNSAVFAEGATLLASNINRLAATYNAHAGRAHASIDGPLQCPSDVRRIMCESLPLEEHSSATLARRAVDVLGYLDQLTLSGRLDARVLPSAAILALEPFCPRYTDALRSRLGIAVTAWEALAVAGSSHPMPEMGLTQ